MPYHNDTQKLPAIDEVLKASGAGPELLWYMLSIFNYETVTDGAAHEAVNPIRNIQATKVGGLCYIDTPESTQVPIYLALGVPQTARVTKVYASGDGTVATGISMGY